MTRGGKGGAYILPTISLIYLWSTLRQTIRLKSWTWVTVVRTNHTPPPTYLLCLSNMRNNPLVVFLVLKTAFIKFSTESNFSNFASASLFKSFSLMDTFLRIHKKVRNNTLKEHFQQASSVSFQQIKLKVLI